MNETSFRPWVSRWALIATLFLIGLLAALVLTNARGSDDPQRFWSAETDDEWMRLIDEARDSTWDGTWPPLREMTPAQALDACTDLPAGATLSQSAIQPSPDGSQERVVAIFFREPDEQYAIALYRDSDFTGCPPVLVAQASEVSGYTAAVDLHICEQMELMAADIRPTDPTLRPASPAVARHYLDAFCG